MEGFDVFDPEGRFVGEGLEGLDIVPLEGFCGGFDTVVLDGLEGLIGTLLGGLVTDGLFRGLLVLGGLCDGLLGGLGLTVVDWFCGFETGGLLLDIGL